MNFAGVIRTPVLEATSCREAQEEGVGASAPQPLRDEVSPSAGAVDCARGLVTGAREME